MSNLTTRQDFKHNYFYENNFIAVSEDFLKYLPPVDSLPMVLCLFGLVNIKHTEKGNFNIVEVDKKDLVRFLNLPDSCKKSTSYLAKWLRVNFSEAMNVRLNDGEYIIDYVENCRGKLLITYNEKVLSRYFEGFTNGKKNKKRYFKIWTGDLYDMANGSRHAWNWRKELMLHSDTSRKSCEFVWTTKQIKNFLGLGVEDYMSITFDRTNFEKYCIIQPLEELNKSQQVTLWHTGNKPYIKVKDGDSNYDYVKGYKFEYKVRNDNIKNPELKKEDVKYGNNFN